MSAQNNSTIIASGHRIMQLEAEKARKTLAHAEAMSELKDIFEDLVARRTSLGERLCVAIQSFPDYAWDLLSDFDGDLYQEMKDLALLGRRIDIVKAFRREFGVGLADAKYAMDKLMNEAWRVGLR